MATKDKVEEAEAPRKVTYFPGDGRVLVEAEVLSENDDGTLNIRYPHRLDASAMATADNVQHGTGGFMWTEPGTQPPASSAASNSPEYIIQLEEEKSNLQVRVEILQNELDARTATNNELVVALTNEQAAHADTKQALADATKVSD